MSAQQNWVILPYAGRKHTFPDATPTVSAVCHRAPLGSEFKTSPFQSCPQASDSQPAPKALTQARPLSRWPHPLLLWSLTYPLLRSQASVISGLEYHRRLLRVQTPPISIHPTRGWQMNFLRYPNVVTFTPRGSAMSYLTSVSLGCLIWETDNNNMLLPIAPLGFKWNNAHRGRGTATGCIQ